MNHTILRRARFVCVGLFLCSISFTLHAQGQTGNFCVRDFQPGAVCTANDVRFEDLTPVTIVEDCSTGTIGETTVIFEGLVSAAGSPDRYDIGVYLALDGGSARDGDNCHHDYLDPPLSLMPTYGDSNSNTIDDIVDGPWHDLDEDDCGDMQTNTEVIKTLTQLTFACVDNNNDGSVDVAVCASWDNNANTTCSVVGDAFPGTNSKCSCGTVELGIGTGEAPDIDVTKDPANQAVALGATASFTITVDNTGDVPLSNIVIDDALCTSLTGPTGDTGNDGVLGTDETWTYDCDVTNVQAAFTNSVTATGTSPAGTDVSDSDTADVTVLAPSLTVSKTPDLQTVEVGEQVQFTITATNTGNTNFAFVTIQDIPCNSLVFNGTDVGGDNIMGPTEVWTWTCTVNSVTSSFTNSAQVCGDSQIIGPSRNLKSNQICQSDTADVVVEAPAIEVSKFPDQQTLRPGEPAVFTITAENTGDVVLGDVTIEDLIDVEALMCTTLVGPAVDAGDDGAISPGETWEYTCTVENVSAEFTNAATVTGTTPGGTDVSDTDTALVTLVFEVPALQAPLLVLLLGLLGVSGLLWMRRR